MPIKLDDSVKDHIHSTSNSLKAAGILDAGNDNKLSNIGKLSLRLSIPVEDLRPLVFGLIFDCLELVGILCTQFMNLTNQASSRDGPGKANFDFYMDRNKGLADGLLSDHKMVLNLYKMWLFGSDGAERPENAQKSFCRNFQITQKHMEQWKNDVNQFMAEAKRHFKNFKRPAENSKEKVSSYYGGIPADTQRQEDMGLVCAALSYCGQPARFVHPKQDNSVMYVCTDPGKISTLPCQSTLSKFGHLASISKKNRALSTKGCITSLSGMTASSAFTLVPPIFAALLGPELDEVHEAENFYVWQPTVPGYNVPQSKYVNGDLPGYIFKTEAMKEQCDNLNQKLHLMIDKLVGLMVDDVEIPSTVYDALGLVRNFFTHEGKAADKWRDTNIPELPMSELLSFSLKMGSSTSKTKKPEPKKPDAKSPTSAKKVAKPSKNADERSRSRSRSRGDRRRISSRSRDRRSTRRRSSSGYRSYSRSYSRDRYRRRRDSRSRSRSRSRDHRRRRRSSRSRSIGSTPRRSGAAAERTKREDEKKREEERERLKRHASTPQKTTTTTTVKLSPNTDKSQRESTVNLTPNEKNVPRTGKKISTDRNPLAAKAETFKIDIANCIEKWKVDTNHKYAMVRFLRDLLKHYGGEISIGEIQKNIKFVKSKYDISLMYPSSKHIESLNHPSVGHNTKWEGLKSRDWFEVKRGDTRAHDVIYCHNLKERLEKDKAKDQAAILRASRSRSKSFEVNSPRRSVKRTAVSDDPKSGSKNDLAKRAKTATTESEKSAPAASSSSAAFPKRGKNSIKWGSKLPQAVAAATAEKSPKKTTPKKKTVVEEISDSPSVPSAQSKGQNSKVGESSAAKSNPPSDSSHKNNDMNISHDNVIPEVELFGIPDFKKDKKAMGRFVNAVVRQTEVRKGMNYLGPRTQQGSHIFRYNTKKDAFLALSRLNGTNIKVEGFDFPQLHLKAYRKLPEGVVGTSGTSSSPAASEKSEDKQFVEKARSVSRPKSRASPKLRPKDSKSVEPPKDRVFEDKINEAAQKSLDDVEKKPVEKKKKRKGPPPPAVPPSVAIAEAQKAADKKKQAERKKSPSPPKNISACEQIKKRAEALAAAMNANKQDREGKSGFDAGPIRRDTSDVSFASASSGFSSGFRGLSSGATASGGFGSLNAQQTSQPGFGGSPAQVNPIRQVHLEQSPISQQNTVGNDWFMNQRKKVPQIPGQEKLSDEEWLAHKRRESPIEEVRLGQQQRDAAAGRNIHIAIRKVDNQPVPQPARGSFAGGGKVAPASTTSYVSLPAGEAAIYNAVWTLIKNTHRQVENHIKSNNIPEQSMLIHFIQRFVSKYKNPREIDQSLSEPNSYHENLRNSFMMGNWGTFWNARKNAPKKTPIDVHDFVKKLFSLQGTVEKKMRQYGLDVPEPTIPIV